MGAIKSPVHAMRAAIVAGHRKGRPMAVTKEDIVARASSMAFGKSLIMNVLRAMILETIVDSALSLDWKWFSTDYAGWDFEHSDLTWLEVKQSSALQSWKTPKESAAIFDIAPRTGTRRSS
jgi:hypothetical protein